MGVRTNLTLSQTGAQQTRKVCWSKMAIKVVLVLIIVSGEVAGAPSWPSWATQTIPTCPKGTKYTVRVTWSGATYGICANKKRKISTKATAGSASDPTREEQSRSRMIKT